MPAKFIIIDHMRCTIVLHEDRSFLVFRTEEEAGIKARNMAEKHPACLFTVAEMGANFITY